MAVNKYGQPVGEPLDFKPPPYPKNVHLKGKYCEIVPMDRKYAADLYESNFKSFPREEAEKRWTYMLSEPPANVEEYTEWYDYATDAEGFVYLTVLDLKTGKPVGTYSYLRIEPSLGTIEVGNVNFSLSMSGTPISTEAQYLLMKHAFELGYRRYEWKCDSCNAPSRKAAARLGFTYEGMFRNWFPYKGRNRDTTWFSVTDYEFPKLEAAFKAWLDPSNFNEDGTQKVKLEDFRK